MNATIRDATREDVIHVASINGSMLCQVEHLQEHEWEPLLRDCYVVEFGQMILAAVGLSMPWDRVGRVWCIVTPEGHNHWIPLARKLKTLMDDHCNRHQLRRLQAENPVSHMNDRFMRFFGFKPEGIMHNYGPGGDEDFVLYARWQHG